MLTVSGFLARKRSKLLLLFWGPKLAPNISSLSTLVETAKIRQRVNAYIPKSYSWTTQLAALNRGVERLG